MCKPFVSAKPGGMGLEYIASEIMEAQNGRVIFPNEGDFEIPEEFKKRTYLLKKIDYVFFLPINGRVAIIDNEIGRESDLYSKYLVKINSYTFVKGDDMDYLPEENDESNDIRLVFLDLNIGNRTPDKGVKDLYHFKTNLFQKTIFPYSIILWSKARTSIFRSFKELFEEYQIETHHN
jgi:hypothetical protein